MFILKMFNLEISLETYLIQSHVHFTWSAKLQNWDFDDPLGGQV